MKKFWKNALTLFCAASIALSASGCSLLEQQKVINAYEIAVQNGFVGTQEEWLASLRGDSGKDGADLDIKDIYAQAQENGYTGTFLQFLEEYLDVDLREDNDTQTIAQNITSVVSVYSAYTTTTTYTENRFPFRQETQVKATASAGSGVIIQLDKEQGDALIVTNYHVLYSAGSDTENGISDCVYVYLYGALNYFTSGADSTGVLSDANGDGVVDKNDQGDWRGDGIKAEYVGGAINYDVAVLRVRGSEYLKNSAASAAKIGDSNTVTVGEKVYAIGNPRSFGISVTGGLISVESESIQMDALDGSNTQWQFRVMRTDAAINSGNSGGGLFNANGELIGITNAKNIQESTDNMGYALPISAVMGIAENILDNNGVFHRAMLGVSTLIVSSKASWNENGKLVINEEVEVQEVLTTGAAYGKIQVGDLFRSVSVNGVKTNIQRDFMLSDALFAVRKGDTVVVEVYRPSVSKVVQLTIVYDKDAYFTLYQ